MNDTKTLAENAYDNTVDLHERVSMLEDKVLAISANMVSVAKMLQFLFEHSTLTESALEELAIHLDLQLATTESIH
jgi:hypothetical protein